MNDSALFFTKFLKHGTAIASIAPSSRWLSEATIREIDWATARTVVELGAGTGPITYAIAQHADPECRIIAIERDADFARRLRDRFATTPNIEIVEGNVGDLAAILRDRGIAQVDEVVSGLPVPSFPRELQRSLFRAVGEFLRPEGGYHQITEIPWIFWRFYRKFFHEVRFIFEPRNLPPAGAYICRGVRE
jgi:phosphatidylethanolamine/phosphatidyl-N-methylethanolamine N-methyltransferase